MSKADQGMRLTDEQRLDWLRLIRSDNVGPRTFRALVNHYGGARAALSALPGLARRGGAKGPARIASREEAQRELQAAQALGATFVALGEPDYPPRLQMIDDAPPLLAVRGNPAALRLPAVALVGARNASAAGLRFAERLARDLGAAGLTVVSGLARGIDAAAHRASLTTGTVAVLAGGHDHIYPREHIELADAILAQGALVSEMPFGHEPRARDFPRRNRLISGLCAGVVVVEAASAQALAFDNAWLSGDCRALPMFKSILSARSLRLCDGPSIFVALFPIDRLMGPGGAILQALD